MQLIGLQEKTDRLRRSGGSSMAIYSSRAFHPGQAESPPTRDVTCDSGTDRASGGWPRRLSGGIIFCLTTSFSVPNLPPNPTNKYANNASGHTVTN
jgi:hypothetical protein